MNKISNTSFIMAFIIFFAAFNPGCLCDDKKKDPPKKKVDTRSKVEYFKDTQSPTKVPHGNIRMDTVLETSDGRIQYQTDDGKTWRVTMTKQADGTYRFGTPDEKK